MRRSGTILIIVAGICALLASLTLAFLLRSRSSLEETNALEADAQARIMLVAACSYVCEASRIGYEPLSPFDPLYLLVDPDRLSISPDHIEAFGWVDVRDGSTGPNTRYNAIATAPPPNTLPTLPGTAELTRIPLWNDLRSVPTGLPSPLGWRRKWPAIDSVARCPMYRLVRPPFALQLTAVYNDLATTGVIGVPYLRNPDPRALAQNQADYLTINPKDALPVRPESMNSSWFRVYRDDVTTFVITVGAGGTQGFRDYDEVIAADQDLVTSGQPARFVAWFNSDPRFFQSLLAQERRMWYRIEWSPAITAPLNHNIVPEVRPKQRGLATDVPFSSAMGTSGQFALYPMNRSQTARADTDRQEADLGAHTHTLNQGGTIRWVQRLRVPPKLW